MYGSNQGYSKSQLHTDFSASKNKGGYNNNNGSDYWDQPMGFTAPSIKLGRDYSDPAMLYDLNNQGGQGSIKLPSPMRNMKSMSTNQTPIRKDLPRGQHSESFNRFEIDDVRSFINENSAFNNQGKHKPRTMSTIKSYGVSSTPQKLELTSMLGKKATQVGINTPMLTKGGDLLPWQKKSSLPLIKPNRDGLFKDAKLPPSGSGKYALKKNQIQYSQPVSAVDEALKKIARAGEDFSTVNEYSRALIKRFDSDNDGVITFQELCDGLESFDIDLSIKDRMALMRKLDVDADGEITEIELSRALHTVDQQITQEAVETCLKKIAAGAEGNGNLRDYVREIVRRFDDNSDGLLTIQELANGLRKMHVFLSQREVQSLMERLDLNRDGEVSADELYEIIKSVDSTFTSGQLSNSVDWVIKRLTDEARSFPSMKDYARGLIRKMDRDNDGIISFQELCEGLAKMSIFISNQEKQALMERLDIDRDGTITENEILRVLQKGGESNSPIVEQTLTKIASGASKYPSMSAYVADLVRKFDRNSDGYLSIQELTDGLRKINIFLTQPETSALMKKLDLNRDGEVSGDEILQVLNSVNGGQVASGGSVDQIINKLLAGSKGFASMRDYCKNLIRKFDRDNDGIITFKELTDGLSKMGIQASPTDKQGLMERLDIDRDGKITEHELLRVFSNGGSDSSAIVEQTIQKIASGASNFRSMQDYVKDLVRRFDRNSDGLLSVQELTEGLKKIGIFLTNPEIQVLMAKLDLNRDGEVSANEILHVLTGAQHSHSSSGGSNVDNIIAKLQQNGSGFASMRDYAKNLIRKFDRDSDGIITFQELCDGLVKMGISATQSDKTQLMQILDIDRDGKITEHELMRVLHGDPNIIDQTILKIAQGATKYRSMSEYVQDLIYRFDKNSDGLLTVQELTDGLKKLGIFLTGKETQGLMNKLDLNSDGEVSADEILRVLGGVASSGNAEQIIHKLSAGAKGFASIRDFAKHLIKKFDRDSDGIISFNELCDGLSKMGINASRQDQQALMDILDIDRDGSITEHEMLRVLQKGVDPQIVHQTLTKIASGASKYRSMSDYVSDLIRKFDKNSDGLLTLSELTEGLKKLGIFLTAPETQALMAKLDLNRDGEVSGDEILKVLSSLGGVLSSSSSVDAIINKLTANAKGFASMRDYAKNLIKRFDRDNDGIITFNELTEGLSKMGINANSQDKRELMERLDIDRDGQITENEIIRVLGGGDANGVVEDTLRKIVGGAKNYKSITEYVKDLVRRFDSNSDGLLSVYELQNGLTKMGIHLTQKEVNALMKKLDLNLDGEVSADEIINVLHSISGSPSSSKKTANQVDLAISKLVQSGRIFSNMRDYAVHLIKKWDRDNDGIITFSELCEGLTKMGVSLSNADKQALMHRLDIDRDGRITSDELFRVLSGGDAAGMVDATLKKIASGAAKYGSLQEYVKDLVRRFDRNSDGLLSIKELTDGLAKLQIFLSQSETQALMNRLDLNRDGEVSAEEIYNVLSSTTGGSSGSSFKASGVDQAIKKLAEGASRYPSMYDYSRYLIKQFDHDNDGIITFAELCNGLNKMKIALMPSDRQGLMQRLDLDRDGKITELELYRVLLGADSNHNSESIAVTQAIKKIAAGAAAYASMAEYVKDLVRKFDRNSDGYLSIQELTEGLKKINIVLNTREIEGLMNKLDINRDGEVSADEILRALNTSSSFSKGSAVTQILKSLLSGSDSFPSLRDYARSLIRRFDFDSDGIITFSELCDGLASLNLSVSPADKQSLMDRLDIDRDGRITEKELYRALQSVEAPAKRLGGVNSVVDQTLKKLASGAENPKDLRGYAAKLIQKFDKDSDGLISFYELTQGLRKINIFLTAEEREALMKVLDVDADGEISEHEIFRALSQISSGDMRNNARQAADVALKKLAAGAEEYGGNMKQYVEALMRKFDYDGDGIITFNELAEGVKRLNIFLSFQERQALMKSLDLDQNGSLSSEELYSVLSRVDTKLTKTELQGQVEQALRKVASGAEDHPNMKSYVSFLMGQFDVNNDGLISFEELVDGLRTLQINLTAQEKKSLMKRFDYNRDGEISEEEIYRVLAPYKSTNNKQMRTLSPVKMVTSNNKMAMSQKYQTLPLAPTSGASNAQITLILEKIRKASEKYQSLNHYITALMSRYDTDGDGLINLQELTRGLEHDMIKSTPEERRALFNFLDVDRDGNISQEEIYNALIKSGGGKSSGNIETNLQKIKQGASRFKSVEEFVKYLFNKYDADRSGTLSFQEFSTAVDSLGLRITQSDKQELMRKLDDDSDGEIAYAELYNGLMGVTKTTVNMEEALGKIAEGANQYRSLDDYVSTIFRRFDMNRDGAVSLQELKDGLKSMNVRLADGEMQGLFNKLDTDHDGTVTQDELYTAVQSRNAGSGYSKSLTGASVDSLLLKIAHGSDKHKSIEDFIVTVFRRFDANQDGAITFKELRDGLNQMQIRLPDSDLQALFTRLDADHDGTVTQYELYNAVVLAQENSRTGVIVKTPASVEHVLKMIKKGADKHPTLRDYVDVLMRKFDRDGDGLIGYEELGYGLQSLAIKVTDQEKLALMKELDRDRDGGVSKFELFNALDTDFAGMTASGIPLGTVETILAAIRKTVDPYKSQQEQLAGLMRIFDKDGDGLINFLELVEGVRLLGIRAQKADLVDVMNRIDIDRDGIVTQAELTKALGLTQAAQKSLSGTYNYKTNSMNIMASSPRIYNNAKPNIQDVIERFKVSMIQQNPNAIRGLGKHFFKKLDRFGNGARKISKYDFSNAMAESKFYISQSDLEAILTFFDTDRNGKINYDEFLIALRGKLNPRRQAIVDKAFLTFDRDVKGAVDSGDLRSVFNTGIHPKVVKGVANNDQAFIEFLSNFSDARGDGKILREEWNDYYSAVSSTVHNDDHFIDLLKITWRLQ